MDGHDINMTWASETAYCNCVGEVHCECANNDTERLRKVWKDTGNREGTRKWKGLKEPHHSASFQNRGDILYSN